ncbi:hypothetical protein CLV98_101514 [Dyadobacter jejuensis]|uniref:Uncharacterized protein n=1 Tax=Dyadobacter jejuensis TaxID=1082580 RepID=A0A316ARH2_9BACT|nr:hypothetical protein [Dyadobacter jejuensis]PWJ60333.1 hypothetical protein CLV98_101514 [Dyadobacter jejuensis]
MAKKLPKNQLPLDFSVHANRIVLRLGQLQHHPLADDLFQRLVQKEWIIEPPGEVADISFAQDIVAHIGHKLPYPEGMKIAQLHGCEAEFKGFSAIFQQKGWIFVNAATEATERNYQIHLLTVSLGLHSLYTTAESLFNRSEQLVFEALLPLKEVESFFRKDIVKIPEFLASDIATFFRVPFPMVLKRALQLRLISDEQYRNFMTINPESGRKPRELFVSDDGTMDDLEAQLFSEE